MKDKWEFNADLPNGLEQAAKSAFRGVWHSAALNLGNEHNWRNLNDDGWYAGLEIGTVVSNDQGGDEQTWEVTLLESGSIMQNCEGASRWQIRIAGM